MSMDLMAEKFGKPRGFILENKKQLLCPAVTFAL